MTAQSQQAGSHLDDLCLFNDEEETVSRNYLMIIEGRLSSKSTTAANDSTSNNNNTNNSTFGHIPSLQDSTAGGVLSGDDHEPSFFMPGDKLIIKAKVYILEILEVFQHKNKIYSHTQTNSFTSYLFFF